MNIWLLHVGEELPVDDRPRLFRYGHLAEALARRGHQVLRWAPTFQHARKQQRFDCDTYYEVQPGYDIHFVHAGGYRKNISWARFRSYRDLARRFTGLAPAQAAPDVIVAGVPSPAWCAAAIDFARPRQIPVVVDVRDLWPDIFLTALPYALRGVGRGLLEPLYRQTARICQEATAITAVSQSYLDWGLANARRTATEFDRVFPLGYAESQLDAATLQAKTEWLVEQGVQPDKLTCSFFGLFERSYDLDTVLRAARRLQQAGRNDIQFVLCGDGGKLAALKRQAADLPNVVLPGWVDKSTIAALMQMSHIGLAAYAPDALQSLPNKPFEYLAGRLAVVSSLQGELAELLRQHGCGRTYRPGGPDSLAGHLVQLADNRDALQAMRAAAYQTFHENYRVETVSNTMGDYLEQIGSVGTAAERRAA